MDTTDNSATHDATHATQGATSDATGATLWLSVADAARLEGVSVRAVQRRCQSGKYGSRRTQTPQGEKLEVDAATLTTHATPRRDAGDGETQKRRDARDGGRDVGDGQSEVAPLPDTPQSAAPDMAARYLERLEGENDFLRRALEQRDRDAAELRAALREALKATPRQLEASNAAPDMASERAPVTTPPQATPEAKERSLLAPKREPRPLWRVILGLR